MKILKIAAMMIGMSFSLPSWALFIGTTDVGALDSIYAQTTLASSGDAVEEAWIKSVLGDSATLDVKYDTTSADWSLVDDETDVFAQLLGTDPAYFMIKMGNGAADGDSHFLYTNNSSTSYAVIDLSLMGFTANNRNGGIINISRVSHVGEVGATSVPAPAPIALLALGLFGLVAARRKTKA